jgi:regulator of Ty1 transposition protein 109
MCPLFLFRLFSSDAPVHRVSILRVHHLSAMALRDALLQSLQTLPGNRTFHLHVLISAPRKHTGLFPYAHPRPRAHLQDILILLSEQKSASEPHIFVTAIEAALYIIPTTDSALLYVAKVDSTGQALAPSPTGPLVRAFLTHYANPSTRPLNVKTLWIHIFARSQTQYLFPNSADFEGKRVLSDIRLCGWWKRRLEEVAMDMKKHDEPYVSSPLTIHLSYLLPGMEEIEATRATQSSANSSPSTVSWEYGQPFSSESLPSPCPAPKGKAHLGHFIPYFEDDPKSRFLDDIASTTEADAPESPAKKRRKLAPEDDEDETKTVAKESQGDHRPPGELGKVSVPEYWERMGFRQECVQGAITGFFALAVSSSTFEQTPATTTPSSLPQRPEEVSINVFRRVHTALTKNNEFSTLERAIRATEVVETLIRDLCEKGSVEDDVPPGSKPSETAASTSVREPNPPMTPKIPPLATLPELPSTPPRKPEERPEPPITPTDVLPAASSTSLETYTTYIYGSMHVNNPSLPPKKTSTTTIESAQPVTILAVRKKKKPVDA